MAANKTSPILYLMLFLGVALDKVKSNKKTPLSFLRGVWVEGLVVVNGFYVRFDASG
jgi:hypothetical protein